MAEPRGNAARRGAWRASGVLLAAALASAVQLAPLRWRLSGSDQPYFADYDELHYGAAIRQAARHPPLATDPYDGEWVDAASPFGWMLPHAIALPLRFGVPAGPWLDAARWGGTFASAYLLIELGAVAASPAVGAAAATLILCDPASIFGKPLASILGVGVIGEMAWPHQLPFSRLYSPSLTFPFFALALLALWRLAARPRNRSRVAAGVATFGLLGAASYSFLWVSGAAAALGTLVRRRTRGAMWPAVAAALAVLLLLVAVNALGRRGVDPVAYALRIGFFRTRAPIFLRHVGFWCGAAAALWLGFGPWRLPLGARLAGSSAVAVWLLAMLHTPLSGWNIQSHHFSYALGPFFTLTWCALGWHAWRRFGRRRGVALLGWGLVGWMGLAGPSWALLGADAAASVIRPAGVLQLQEAVAASGIGGPAEVLVPRGLRAVLGGTTAHVAFAHEYLHMWALPDSVIWARQVCAGALVGEDSADVEQAVVPKRHQQPIWGWGRPDDFSLVGVRSYNEIAARLGALQGGAVAAASRDPQRLRDACGRRPDYVLVLGRARGRRASAAAAVLGGRVRRAAPDTSWLWLEFPRGGAGDLRRP